jgi:ApbE superfamily uncharacterized protein (UPF0280 family)
MATDHGVSINVCTSAKKAGASPAIGQAQALVAQGRRVTIGEILRAFTPTQCANYFRNSG